MSLEWRSVHFQEGEDWYCHSRSQFDVIRDGETVIHAHAERTGIATEPLAVYGGRAQPDRPVYRIVDCWHEAPEGLFVLLSGWLWPIEEWRAKVR